MSDIKVTINSTATPIKIGTIGLRLAGLDGNSSVTYSNTTPTWVSLGGIDIGSTFENQTMTEMWNKLLYPYVNPTVSLSSNPVSSVQEFGTSINSMTLTADIIKKSNNITKVEYYKNNTLIHTNSSPNVTGGTDSYTDTGGVNITTNYYVKVYDNSGNTTNSSTLTFTYVNPYYIGNFTTTSPTESDIKGLTKIIKAKSDTNYSFSLTNSRFVIAYDKSYGTLSTILDQNLFNVTSDFSLDVINLTINSLVVPYYYYVFNNLTTQTTFNLQFKY